MSRVTRVSRVTFLENGTGYVKLSQVTCSKIVTGYPRVTGYFFRKWHGLRKISMVNLFETFHGLQINATGYLLTIFSLEK